MHWLSQAAELALLIAVSARCIAASPIMPTGALTPRETCPGVVEVGGIGAVEIVATQWNIANGFGGKVEVEGNKIMPNFNGRSYWADACHPGQYNNSEYLAVPLLGKAITFSTDLSEAGCGCNVAFYLTSLHQNSKISDCKDYYCDANEVCGVRCDEIDIMEANRYAWWSTLHTEDDRYGVGKGYGGGGPDSNGQRDWSREEYGPDGRCINTTKPFQVTAGFPLNTDGGLEAMTIRLWQRGQPCNLSVQISHYNGNTTNSQVGINEGIWALGKALAAGMTPIVSLWGADDLAWLDGLGNDRLGPCKEDSQNNCPIRAALWDFYVEDLPPPFVTWRHYLWAVVGVAVLCIAAAAAKFIFPKTERKYGSTDESSSSE